VKRQSKESTLDGIRAVLPRREDPVAERRGKGNRASNRAEQKASGVFGKRMRAKFAHKYTAWAQCGSGAGNR